jgi:hypothetical protein
MPNYVVQDRATGEVVYAYTADEPSHTDVYPFDAFNHIPQVVVIAPVVREISGITYLRRFTQAERIAIRGAASQSSVLDDYLKLLDATIAQGGTVNLDDEDTVAAVALLEQAGLIAAGRGAEILA